MPFCKNCGHTLKDGAKFCGRCGAAQNREEPAPQTEPAPPPQQSGPAPEPTVPPQPKNNSRVIIIVLAVLLAMAVCVAGYLYIRSRNPDTVPAGPEVASSESGRPMSRASREESERSEARDEVETPAYYSGEAMGNLPANIQYMGFVTQQGEWIYYLKIDSVAYETSLWKKKTDGSQDTKLLDGAQSLYLNVLGDWLYYYDNNEEFLMRMPLDGSGPPIALVNLYEAYGDSLRLIVHEEGIYYINWDRELVRVSHDGAHREVLSFVTPVDNFTISGDTIYALSEIEQAIYRSNLDGSDSERFLRLPSSYRSGEYDVTGFADAAGVDLAAKEGMVVRLDTPLELEYDAYSTLFADRDVLYIWDSGILQGFSMDTGDIRLAGIIPNADEFHPVVLDGKVYYHCAISQAIYSIDIETGKRHSLAQDILFAYMLNITQDVIAYLGYDPSYQEVLVHLDRREAESAAKLSPSSGWANLLETDLSIYASTQELPQSRFYSITQFSGSRSATPALPSTEPLNPLPAS